MLICYLGPSAGLHLGVTERNGKEDDENEVRPRGFTFRTSSEQFERVLEKRGLKGNKTLGVGLKLEF